MKKFKDIENTDKEIEEEDDSLFEIIEKNRSEISNNLMKYFKDQGIKENEAFDAMMYVSAGLAVYFQFPKELCISYLEEAIENMQRASEKDE